MQVDLSGARCKVHWRSVLGCIQRSKAMLTSAVVRNVSTPSVLKVLQMLSRCPNLEHLEICDASNGQELYDLFKGSKRLKSLMTSSVVNVSQADITKIMTALPRLESVRIYSAINARCGEVLWPRELPNLKCVSFCSWYPAATTAHYPGLLVPGLFIDRTGSPVPRSVDVCYFLAVFQICSTSNVHCCSRSLA